MPFQDHDHVKPGLATTAMTTNQSVIKLPSVACSMITKRGRICQSVPADSPGINRKMVVMCSTLTRNLVEVCMCNSDIIFDMSDLSGKKM